MGLYSIDRCSELGKQIQTVSRDHDSSGRSLALMKHSGAVMTGALLQYMVGENRQSLASFSSADAGFLKALQDEQARPEKSPEEKSLLAKLASAYKQFQSETSIFLNGAVLPEPLRSATAGRLGNSVSTILDLVEELNLAHEHALNSAGHDGAAEINETVRIVELLGIIALVATILAWTGLNRGLVYPLRTLTTSIQQVGAGNLDQEVPVLDNYELGMLAKSFNVMAAQLKEYRANASVELQRLNLTIRSTLALVSRSHSSCLANSQGAVEFRNPEADQLAVQLLFSGVTRLPKKVDDKVEHVRATGQDYLPTLFKDAIKFHLKGQDRYFLPRIVLLRDESRQTFGVAVILEDVTRMLLLDDVKSNLISTVSHELKTPLTSVRMALYLLFEKTVGELNEKQLDLVATARQDADRLLRTLNDLLDLAKLEQGPSQLDLVLVSPKELVEEAVHDTRDVALSAGLVLKMEIEPSLPRVEVDRQRIAYVFSNLITNAIKYSPNSALVLIRAQMGQNRAGAPGVRFSVRDQGDGISPRPSGAYIRAFLPGSRHTEKRRGLGTFHRARDRHGSSGRDRSSQRARGGERIFLCASGLR